MEHDAKRPRHAASLETVQSDVTISQSLLKVPTLITDYYIF